MLEPEIQTLFWRSIWLASISTAICLVVGYPMALVIATAPAKWKPWLLLIVILPFWTNLLIRTYALLNILGTRGRVNEGLEWLWIRADGFLNFVGLGAYDLIGEEFEPIVFLGRWSGVIIGLVYVQLPFTILPIYASLERLDRSFLEASLDLGASQWRTFRSILLPLTMPGVITAAIITFIPMLGSFLTPALLGRGQVDMIANVIERQFKGANDWPFGSAMSLFLLYRDIHHSGDPGLRGDAETEAERPAWLGQEGNDRDRSIMRASCRCSRFSCWPRSFFMRRSSS